MRVNQAEPARMGRVVKESTVLYFEVNEVLFHMDD